MVLVANRYSVTASESRALIDAKPFGSRAVAAPCALQKRHWQFLTIRASGAILVLNSKVILPQWQSPLITEVNRFIKQHSRIRICDSNGRCGSQADLFPNTTRTAASGTNPAVQTNNFENPELNDCFPRKRSFTSLNISEIEGRLSAEAVSKRKIDRLRTFPS